MRWLRDDLPGGAWILPHWQDGPYWLVPVVDSTEANWQAALLLAAHTPLVESLPVNSPLGGWCQTQVFTVSQFTRDILMWHRGDETGLQLDEEDILGPFDQRPTASDLVAALVQLFDLDVDKLGERGALVTSALAALAAHPDRALAVIAAIGAGVLATLGADEQDPAAPGLAILLTAAGVLAEEA